MKHRKTLSKPVPFALLYAAIAAAHGCSDGETSTPRERTVEDDTLVAANAPVNDSAAAPGAGDGQSAFGQCPEDEGPVTCDGITCPQVDAQAATLCTQSCCTDMGACGTFNASVGTACVDASGGDGHSCPMATVFGAQVPGCCFAGSNSCGVLDVTGVLGGSAGADDNNCVLRSRIPLSTLEPLNCDGSAVAASDGAGGAAGASPSDGSTGGSMMVGGGGAGVGGAGGSDQDASCPPGTVCAENAFVAGQGQGSSAFCGTDGGFVGHSPIAGSSQVECDSGPGGVYQDFGGVLGGCFITCS
jgi:hypothetical protein